MFSERVKVVILILNILFGLLGLVLGIAAIVLFGLYDESYRAYSSKKVLIQALLSSPFLLACVSIYLNQIVVSFKNSMWIALLPLLGLGLFAVGFVLIARS